jgi:glutaminase
MQLTLYYYFFFFKLSRLSNQVYGRTPQTAKANPDAFGVAICTVDGQRYSVGDAKQFFLIEAIR